MKNIIVTAAGATYAAGIGGSIVNINSLTAGSIAFFEEYNQTVIDGVAPAPNAASRFFTIYTSRTINGTTIPKLIAQIDRASLSYEKTAYGAGANKVVQFAYRAGTDLLSRHHMPASLVVGSVATIIVEDLEELPKDNGFRKKYFEYNHTVEVGDDYSIIIADLIAKITADVTCPATPTDTSGAAGLEGFYLTGKATGNFFTGYNFTCYGMNILANADVCESTNSAGTVCILGGKMYSDTATGAAGTLTLKIGAAASIARSGSKGIGVSRDAVSAEQDALVIDGYSDRHNAINTWNVPDSIVAGTNYSVHTLTWKADESNAQSVQHSGITQTLQIFIPTGEALVTTMDTILATL